MFVYSVFVQLFKKKKNFLTLKSDKDAIKSSNSLVADDVYCELFNSV